MDNEISRFAKMHNSAHVIVDSHGNTIAITLNAHTAECLGGLLMQCSQGTENYPMRLARPEDCWDLQTRIFV